VGGGGVARHSVGVSGDFFIAQQDFLHRLGLFRAVGGKTLAQHNGCALDGLRLDGKRTLGKRHIVVRVCAHISGGGDGILAGILALSTSQRDTFQRFTVQYTTAFVSQFGVFFLIYLGLVVWGDGGGALGNGEFSSSGAGIQLVVGVGDGCRDGVSTCLGGRCGAGVLGAIVGCAGVGQRHRNGFTVHNAGKYGSGGGDTSVSAAVGRDAHSNRLGVDRNGCSAGRSCIFFVALGRGERPRSRIVARSWLERAIRPCECTVNRLAASFHLTCNFTVIQRLTIGNIACADGAVRHRNILVFGFHPDG